jgi:signal transduction histidine kinase/DNA-binding response OmpR family regulator
MTDQNTNLEKRVINAAMAKMIGVISIGILIGLGGYLTARWIYNTYKKSSVELQIAGNHLSKARYLWVNFMDIDLRERQYALESIYSNKKRMERGLEIFAILDSLSAIPLVDSSSAADIDRLREQLVHRQQLFDLYMNSKRNVYQAKLFDALALSITTRSISLNAQAAKEAPSKQLDTRDQMVPEEIVTFDSIFIIKENQPDFFQRLFGRKKEQTIDTLTRERQIQITPIEEELDDSNREIEQPMIAIDQVRSEMEAISSEWQTLRSKNLKRERAYLTASLIIHNEMARLSANIESAILNKFQTTYLLYSKKSKLAFSYAVYFGVAFLVLASVLTVLIISDFRRSKKLRTQLDEQRAVAERHLADKEQFVANISHEIKTPLQSIIGHAECLIDSEGSIDKNSLNAIKESSSYLNYMVNELLEYSSLASGKIEVYNQHFQLYRLVNAVIDILSPEADKKNIKIIRNLESIKSYSAYTDPHRVEQILFNIVGNAIKYTNEGFVKVVLTLEQMGQESGILISISDTGSGIPHDKLQSIFNAYERLESRYTTQEPGSGLGLSITQAIVQKLGGRIVVQSELNKGSTFDIFLPLPVIDESTQAILKYDTTKILVVDDDEFILDFVKRVLTDEGFQVITTSKPHEAEILLQNEDIGLILIDLRMPDIRGDELINRFPEAMRNHVVLMTAEPRGSQLVLATLPFENIIYKPFKTEELLDMIKRKLNGDSKELPRESFNFSVDYPELYIEVLQSCLDDLRLLLHYIIECDKDSAHELAHRLASRIGQIGLNEFGILIREIEFECESETPVFDDLIWQRDMIEALQNGQTQISAILEQFSSEFQKAKSI